MPTLTVNLGPRSYPIRVDRQGAEGAFAAFAAERLAAGWEGRGCRSALVVVDQNTREFAAPYVESLATIGVRAEVAEVPAGEASKCLKVAERLYERLIALRADRHTLIVALGGGVIGDLAGFVAATYARGLPLLMVPTTLLADVDSSVGGKVGVNLASAKNIVGAFHQPIGVWIDLGHLRTLPARELRCGLAEVVKHGMILDEPFFRSLQAGAALLAEADAAELGRVILRSCEIKAAVVTEDEREQTGLRAVLNFGHTIGHAIEAVAGYGDRFRHGEAVSAGMVLETRLAEQLGLVEPEVAEALVDLLARLALPTAAEGLSVEAMMAAMMLDKKNRGGEIRFLLPRAIGRVEATAVPSDRLRAFLEGQASLPVGA